MTRGEPPRNDVVAYVSSPGGVLLDAMAFSRLWDRPAAWFAVRAHDTEVTLSTADVRWLSEPAVMPGSLAAATLAARRSLRRTRPSWVVSAGTAVAVPFFLAAAQLGVPTLWIETQNMVGRQGRAAAVCSRLAERVLVQRPEQLIHHRRAILLGELY